MAKKKNRKKLIVEKIPNYVKVEPPAVPVFEPMPYLYLELFENKNKVIPELRNEDYHPPYEGDDYINEHESTGELIKSGAGKLTNEFDIGDDTSNRKMSPKKDASAFRSDSPNVSSSKHDKSEDEYATIDQPITISKKSPIETATLEREQRRLIDDFLNDPEDLKKALNPVKKRKSSSSDSTNSVIERARKAEENSKQKLTKKSSSSSSDSDRKPTTKFPKKYYSSSSDTEDEKPIKKKRSSSPSSSSDREEKRKQPSLKQTISDDKNYFNESSSTSTSSFSSSKNGGLIGILKGLNPPPVERAESEENNNNNSGSSLSGTAAATAVALGAGLAFTSSSTKEGFDSFMTYNHQQPQQQKQNSSQKTNFAPSLKQAMDGTAQPINRNAPSSSSSYSGNSGYSSSQQTLDVSGARLSREQIDEKTAKNDLLFKFKILRKQYKNVQIDEFDEHSDFEHMKKTYEDIVRQIRLDSCVATYTKYLTIGFYVVEFALVRFLGFTEIQGFTKEQLVNMEPYERLLIEIGEKQTLDQKKQWSPEMRLLAAIVTNAVTFVLTKMALNAVGKRIFKNSDKSDDSSSGSSSGGSSSGGGDMFGGLGGLGGLGSMFSSFGNIFGGGSSSTSTPRTNTSRPSTPPGKQQSGSGVKKRMNRPNFSDIDLSGKDD